MSPYRATLKLKITGTTILFVSLLLICLVILTGCKVLPKEPDWTKSKLLAGRAQKLSHISALIADERYVYVAMGGTIADQQEGKSGIRRIALDSGEVTVLESGDYLPAAPGNKGLAVDEKYLYWSIVGGIVRIPKAGGKAEVVTANSAGIPA